MNEILNENQKHFKIKQKIDCLTAFYLMMADGHYVIKENEYSVWNNCNLIFLALNPLLQEKLLRIENMWQSRLDVNCYIVTLFCGFWDYMAQIKVQNCQGYIVALCRLYFIKVLAGMMAKQECIIFSYSYHLANFRPFIYCH